MMEPLFVWLLGLPNGIRFQKFKFVWRWERDIPFVAALVKACSNTIEHVDLNSGAKCTLNHPPVSAMRLSPDLITRPNQWKWAQF